MLVLNSSLERVPKYPWGGGEDVHSRILGGLIGRSNKSPKIAGESLFLQNSVDLRGMFLAPSINSEVQFIQYARQGYRK